MPATLVDAPRFSAPPRVRGNPNAAVPLAAILHVEADRPVEVSATITDGSKGWHVRFPSAGGQGSGGSFPLVGLRAGRMHLITVSLTDRAGNTTTAAPVEHRTPALPQSQTAFPPITLVKRDKARSEGGITLLSVRRRPLQRAIFQTERQRRWQTKWAMLVAVDGEGEVVWTYRSPVRIAGIEALDNGHIFFHTTEFQSVEIDMLGNEVRSFVAARRPQGPLPGAVPVEAASIHHQPHQMPSGNFLAITANAREIEGYYTSETDPSAPRATKRVVGDRIIEFTPEGREVWSWNTFDHLDPFRIGYALLEPYWHTRGFPHHADWSHGNGVTFDPATETVIISLKHQSAIVGIDYRTGEIAWILGNAKGWSDRLRSKVLRPVGEPFQMIWNQHNPRVTGRGTIVLYDNGSQAAMPFDPPKMPHETFSRAVELEIDRRAMTVRQVWASHDRLGEDSVHCWAMGDAHILPRTGNVLVVDSMIMTKRDDYQWNEWNRARWHPNDFPYWCRIREYTHTSPPEVVWEIRIEDPDDIVAWEVFGGLRLPSLWAATGASAREIGG